MGLSVRFVLNPVNSRMDRTVEVRVTRCKSHWLGTAHDLLKSRRGGGRRGTAPGPKVRTHAEKNDGAAAAEASCWLPATGAGAARISTRHAHEHQHFHA